MPIIKPRDVRIVAVIDALEENPQYVTVDLAALVHLSSSRFEHLFKEQMGVPLSEYVSQIRLQRAACMLASSEEPVKSVAFVAGYRHASSFIRAFSSRFAESPTEYRKRMQGSRAISD